MSRNAAFLVVLLLAVAVVLAPFVRAWFDQQARIDALQADISQREKSVAELKLAEQRWQDPSYVITQARKRFTFVMPGEVGYVVLDTPQTVAAEKDPSSAAAKHASSAKGSWVATMWRSVEEAGQAPTDPVGTSSSGAASSDIGSSGAASSDTGPSGTASSGSGASSSGDR